MVITDTYEWESIKSHLKTSKIFIVDIETTGLSIHYKDYIIGIGVATLSEAYYFPVAHVSHKLSKDIISELISILNDAKIIINHNIKFDLAGLSKLGFNTEGKEFIDTLVMSRMCTEDRFAKLDLITSCNRFVGYTKDNKAELKEYMKKKKIKRYELVDHYFMGNYCIEDVINTRNLYFALLQKVKETHQEFVYEHEKRTTKTLFEMEYIGSKIDIEYCNKVYKELFDRAVEIENQALEITKEPVDLLSPKQVGDYFHSLGIKSPGRTPAGKESWDEKVLININHPLVGVIKEYRTIRKLRDTYFEPFLETEVLHPSFNNWGTVTGRLSCSNPNLQNIPRFQKSISGNEVISDEKKEKIKAMVALKSHVNPGSNAGGSGFSSWGFTGDESFDEEDDDVVSVRRLFISRPGRVLYSFDYSQAEVRVFVSYLNRPEIIKLISDKEFDFHGFVCELVFNKYKDKDEDFKFYRQISKAITFGLIYGMGDGLLAAQMGRPIEEAKNFRKLYFERLPGAIDFINNVNAKVLRTGCIKNRYGRKYWISPDKAYVGVNYLVQGTAGDLVKDRMNALNDFLKNTKSRMINQIHDEVIVEIPIDEEAEIVPKITEILEKNRLNIPMKVDIARCYPSWANKPKEE